MSRCLECPIVCFRPGAKPHIHKCNTRETSFPTVARYDKEAAVSEVKQSPPEDFQGVHLRGLRYCLIKSVSSCIFL